LLRHGNGAIGTQKQQNKKTKNKKEGTQAPPMLRFCDGVHLHQKQPKKKEKKGGGAKALLLSIFSDGAHMCPKATKKQKGNQIVLRLGDGAHLCLKTTKQKERIKKKKGV